MNKYPLLGLLTFCLLFSKCDKHPSGFPQFPLGIVGDNSSEVCVGEWQLSGPYFINSADKQVNSGDAALHWDSSARYIIKDDHVDLGKLFNTSLRADYYAACIINSSIGQNVAFLMGTSGTIKVWVNDKVCLRETKSRTERNENVLPVHLKKGKNLVILKVGDVTEKKTFYFNISSIRYARKLYVLYNSANFLDKILLKEGDPLTGSFKDSLVPAGDSIRIMISDPQYNRLIEKRARRDKTWSLPLTGLPGAGSYICRIEMDSLLFEQRFIYGDHEKMSSEIEKTLGRYGHDDRIRINLETMRLRYEHLDSTGKKDGFDNLLSRKIALTLSDLESASVRLKNKKEAFADMPGLHIRGFRSQIDGGIDNYMLYIPRTYNRKSPIPMVIIMPFITNQIPFIKSWRVADVNGIDMVNYLAEKYGYAVLSPSSRIYDEYNLNPLLEKSTFEALQAVSKDYNIDTSRLYLYGSCAGGAFGLLVANRYPSVFAAVGAKGPELSYTNEEDPANPYPPDWLKNNNILNFAVNYQGTPVYIIHSEKDEKANYDIAHRLSDSIKDKGGSSILETILNASKTKDFDLYPTADITEKMFQFFRNKTLATLLTINFSTAQLKYNTLGWITIDEFDSCQKATINAAYKGHNLIEINTENILRFSVNLSKLPAADAAKPIRIITNGRTSYDQIPLHTSITITVDQPGPDAYRFVKTHTTEGPINDLFGSSFMIVEGTVGRSSENKANRISAAVIIDKWNRMYHSSCRIKRDVEINPSDIRNYNLILVGTPASNSIFHNVAIQLPIKIFRDSIVIRNKSVKGNDLAYTMIYPNPLHQATYILLSGCNDATIPITTFDLTYKGWYDYDIFSLSAPLHEIGVFGMHWE